MQYIQAAGGFIHHQYIRIGEHGAGDAHPLPFAAGEPGAHLAHLGVVAVGQGGDKIMQPCFFGCLYDFFAGSLRFSDGNVVRDGAVKQERILLQYGDAPVQFLQRQLLDGNVVDENLSFLRIPEAEQQPENGGFSDAAFPHDSHLFIALHIQMEILQHFFPGSRITKGDVFKPDRADGAASLRMFALHDFRPGILDEEQPFRSRVGFQQAGDHRGQGLGGGEGSHGHKGQHNGSRRFADAGSRQIRSCRQNGDPCQIHEKGGCRQHRLLMQGEAVGRPVDGPVLLLYHGQPLLAEIENLDIPETVNAFQHQGFHLSQPLPVAGSDGAPRFHGDAGEHHADHQINGKQHRRKKRVNGNGDSQGHAGKKNHREHGTDGVSKEKFDGFNVRYGDVHQISLFPVHQAGGSQTADGTKQLHPHMRQQPVGAHMGNHTLQIPADHDQRAAYKSKKAIQQG